VRECVIDNVWTFIQHPFALSPSMNSGQPCRRVAGLPLYNESVQCPPYVATLVPVGVAMVTIYLSPTCEDLKVYQRVLGEVLCPISVHRMYCDKVK
jgi:hypothetical protein